MCHPSRSPDASAAIGEPAADECPHVVVWSEARGGAAAVARVLAGHGLGVHVITGAADGWPPPSRLCAVAVVAAALDADPSACERTIRRLTTAGYEVLACQDGADARPLASRCGLLLAGCPVLIDSAAPTFDDDCAAAVWPAIRRAATRHAEEEQLRAAMLGAGLVATTPAMLDVCRVVLRISALGDLATLIVGESGTGKERLALLIHRHDARRAGGPFIAVNCSTLGPGLADAELFGHRRGAFTGADRDRKGLFRAAHRGVLFLDEVAELSPPVQAKLLRVLQEGRVLAVGEEREEAVDVRIVAATNADLAQMVAAGTFRADLYHRLNVLSVRVPPLRERPGDVPELVRHFVRKHRHLHPEVVDVHPEFLEAVGHLQLPGNARELENLVRWALVQHDGAAPLGLRDLPVDVVRDVVRHCRAADIGSEAPGLVAPPSGDAGRDWNLARTLRACERSLVEAALAASHGNQAATARLLGITPRSVYTKLRRHRMA